LVNTEGTTSREKGLQVAQLQWHLH
jgi:hypothetical protein